jgi:hypothetical protein
MAAEDAHRGIQMLRDTLVLLLFFTPVVCSGSDDQGKQAELDAACESARQLALGPKRSDIYQECVDKFKNSDEVCGQEANRYNGNRVGGSPLFYDLPECEAAFEYRHKDRD